MGNHPTHRIEDVEQPQTSVGSQKIPLTLLFAMLGRSGMRVMRFLPLVLSVLGHGLTVFFRDILHGCHRILRFLGRILMRPIRIQKEIAKQVQLSLRAAKGKGRRAWCKAILRGLRAWLLGEEGLLITMFHYAVPIVCFAVLFSVVTYGANLEYGVSVNFNGTHLGYVAEEQDYTLAERIARERISYAGDRVELPFQRNLTLEVLDGKTPFLTAGGLADEMLKSANVSLCTGYGVYVNDDFLGAVADKKPIEDALSQQLAAYSEALPVVADAVFFADTVSYVQGTYLADSLVDADALASRLSARKDTIGTYTAAAGDTLYAIAAKYTMTLAALQESNPTLPDVLEAGTKVNVRVVESYLPIAYTTTATAVSFVQYDTVRIETAALPVGSETVLVAGKKGEKNNVLSITYLDGVEATRTVLQSTLQAEPVTEQIGVGTYAAAPASASTRLYGTGQYSWPVNGGYISDPFLSNRNHRGLDIAANAGTEIYAADDGVVRTAGWNNEGYGYYIILEHADGYETLYAHCSLLLAAVGETVSRGQLIAQVGSTGNSTGNHLHFEVRVNGVNFDPAAFMRVNATDE